MASQNKQGIAVLRRLGLALLAICVIGIWAGHGAVGAPIPGADQPIYSEIIPTTAGLPYAPERDVLESFTAPNGATVDVLVKGPAGDGTYSRAMRRDETADTYFPAIVQEAVQAGAHHIVVPLATYRFRGPTICSAPTASPAPACFCVPANAPVCANTCSANFYYYCAPNWAIGISPSVPTLVPTSVVDLDIDFSGSTLAFKAPIIGISIFESARLRLRNVTLDWPDLPIASLGTVVPDPRNPGHKAIVIDTSYPAMDAYTGGPVQIEAVDRWDASTADPPGHFDKSSINPSEVYFGFSNSSQPTYVGHTSAGAQTFSCKSCNFATSADPGCNFFAGCANFDIFAASTRVIVRHYDGNGYAVVLSWCNDISFDNVTLLTGPGNGYGSSGGGVRGLRIAHSRIDRAPGRLISVASVGVLITPQADTIIEDNVIGHQGDDGINPASTVTAITQVSGTTITVPGYCDPDPADNPLKGDALAFFNADSTFLGLAHARAVGGSCDAPVVTLSRAITGLDTTCTLVDLTQGPDARLIIRHNEVRANRGHGALVSAFYGLVTDNRFTENSMGGVSIEGGNGQGPGGANLIVRKTIVKNPGDGARDFGAISAVAFTGEGVPLAAPAFQKILFTGNRVEGAQGPGIVATSMDYFAIDHTNLADVNRVQAQPILLGKTSTNDSVVIDLSRNGTLCATRLKGATTGPIGIDPSDRDVTLGCAAR